MWRDAHFLFNFRRTNAPEDNEDEAYSASSPAAPHAATTNDDIASQCPPTAANVSLFLCFSKLYFFSPTTTMTKRR
jgi:hypothetical protein